MINLIIQAGDARNSSIFSILIFKFSDSFEIDVIYFGLWWITLEEFAGIET